VKCHEGSEADGLRLRSDIGEAGGHSRGAAGVAAVGASTSQDSPAGPEQAMSRLGDGLAPSRTGGGSSRIAFGRSLISRR